MSLDFSANDFDNFNQVQDNNVYIYGIKQDFESIFTSIKELSQKSCKILNPFINVGIEKYGNIEKPYRYVLPIAIAMREAL